MQKNPLIGVSIIVVVLLVLVSFTNAVSFQIVASSNQKATKEEIVNQKELLFQTILDIANNKEIQKVILTSEMKQGEFFNHVMRFSVITPPPVLTKKFLNTAYRMGVMLSKAFSLSRMHSLLEWFQVSNQGVEKEITAVIEKDATLNGKITQLSNLKCNCEKGNTTRWSFPIICRLLFPLFAFALGIYLFHHGLYIFLLILHSIGLLLNCFWSGTPIPV
jgi:hypothetical protein